MKTHAQALPRKAPLVLGMAAILLAAAVFAFSALFAQAVEGPHVTTAIHTNSHATTTQASIGTVVHAYASVASTTASTTLPTGSVTFNLYANTQCSGTPATQTNVALVNGVAESATTSVPATGLSYRVNYNGDATSTPSQGSCTALIATAPSPVLTTTLSTSTVPVGTFVHDTAVLTNITSTASGTVAYKVYTNNACTAGAQNAGVKAVTNGSVPNSDSIQFNTPGSYFWQAVYSGDTYNTAATSSCQSGALHVFATSTPLGRITVDKVTVPSGATSTFQFVTTGAGYDDFSLTDAATPNSQLLAPGTYRISESTQKGWKLTSALCSRNGATSTAYAPGSALTLASGDTVTCTFTNTQATSTGPGGKPGHGHNDDHDDNGNHKGWILGLPFGILKKVFNGDFIPPGIQKKWEDRIDQARDNHNKEDKNDNDDDKDDDKSSDKQKKSSFVEDKMKELKQKVKDSWGN